MTDFKVEAAFGSDYRATTLRKNISANSGATWTNVAGITIATGIVAQGKTWTRLTANSAPPAVTARQNMNLGLLTSGASYVVSHTLYNDGATPVRVALDWCDLPQSVYTIAPGQTIRAATTGARAYDATYRFTDIGFLDNIGDNILVSETLVEAGTTALPYFPQSQTTFPGPAASAWTDISDCVKSVKTRRGRNTEYDEIETGTVSIELDNADGRFTPKRVPAILNTNLVTNPSFRSSSGTFAYRQNLALNPGCEFGTINWNSNNGANWTISADTTVKRSGTQSYKSTPTALQYGAGSRTILSMYNVGGGVFAAAVGDIITAAVNVAHNSGVPGEAQLQASFLDAGSAVLATANGTMVTGIPGDSTFGTRVSVTTAAAPANTASVRLILTVNRQNGQGNLTGTEVAWADECLVEKSAVLYPYFDGSSSSWLTSTQIAEGFTVAWAGTANNSASNLLLPYHANTGPLSHYNSAAQFQASGRVFTQGEYRQRLVCKAVQAPGSIIAFSQGADALTYLSRVNVGDYARSRIQVRTLSGATLQILPRLGYYNSAAANTGLEVGPAVAVPADGSWVDVVVPASVAAPAGTTSVRYLLYANSTWAAGTEIEFRNALTDVGTLADPNPYAFYDGGATFPFSKWTGTADASTSQMYEAGYYPYIKPGVPIRVTASADSWVTASYVAYGFAEKWPVKLDNLTTVDLSITDAFGLFAKRTVAVPVVARTMVSPPRVYAPLCSQEYGYTELVSGKAVTAIDAPSGGATVQWDDATYPPIPRMGDDGASGWCLSSPSGSIGTALSFPYQGFANVLDTGTYYGGGTLSFWWVPDARATVTNAPTQTLLAGTIAPGIQATGVAAKTGYSFNGGSTIYAVEGKPVYVQLSWNALNASLCTYTVQIASELTGWVITQVANLGTAATPSSGFYLGGDAPFTYASMATGRFSHFKISESQGGSPGTGVGGSANPGAGQSETAQLLSALGLTGWNTAAVNFDAAKSSRLSIDYPAGTSTLTILKDIAADAGGLLFIAADGRPTYKNRASRAGSVVEAAFTVASGMGPEPGINTYVDDSHIVNEVNSKYPGTYVGETLTFKDATSANTYGPSPVDLETTVLSQLERIDRANNILLVADTEQLRVEGVGFNVSAFPNPALLLGIEIGDRISVEFPSAAPFASAEFIVEGVSIDVTPIGSAVDGHVSFDLSLASLSDRWVLESATFGALDSTAILAY